jgi:hypothetical protein
MPQSFIKDTTEDLDYEFDFAAYTNGVSGATSNYLQSGETITSFDVDAEDGITVGDSLLTKSDTCVKVWLSGGTLGALYAVTVTVTTSDARTAERTIYVRLENR